MDAQTQSNIIKVIEKATFINSFPNLKTNLRSIMDHYLITTEDEPEQRDNMYATFTALNIILSGMEGVKLE